MLIERASASNTTTTTSSNANGNAISSSGVHHRRLLRGRTHTNTTILLMKAGARLLCGVMLLCALHVSFNVFRQLEALDSNGGDAAAVAAAAVAATSEPPLPPPPLPPPQVVAATKTECPLLPVKSIALQWADPTYAQNVSEHRGGWKAVMQGLLDDGVVHLKQSNNHNHNIGVNLDPPYHHRNVSNEFSSSSSSTVVLLDMAEKWFVWDQQPAVLQPWIGITHLVLHPPKPFEGMDLMGLLDNPNFQQSLPYCVGIVVLHQDGVELMEQHLRELPLPPPPLNESPLRFRRRLPPLHHHTRPTSPSEQQWLPTVCPLLHPIGVESTARHYDPTIDLPYTLQHGGLLLLGQQYRRASTIHRFPHHPRKRYWMSGSQKPDNMQHVLKSVLKATLKHERVKYDPAVEMVYATTHEEYDQWLKHNVVIIDLTCATANNAVLEILALRVPAFVSRLPSTIEYLGPDYPLLFDSFEDLNARLSWGGSGPEEDAALAQALQEGYEYLRNRDVTPFSIAALGEGLRECAARNLQRHCEINQRTSTVAS